jgi:hypothetical protein
MYNSDKNKSNYEGPFAWRPDRVEGGIWSNREVHEKPFSPNIEVTRNWYDPSTPDVGFHGAGRSLSSHRGASKDE